MRKTLGLVAVPVVVLALLPAGALAVPADGEELALSDIALGLEHGLSYSSYVELRTVLNTDSLAGLVFDKYAADDFKFVALDVEDIELVDDGFKVLVRRSKTDQEGEGRAALTGVSDDPLPEAVLGDLRLDFAWNPGLSWGELLQGLAFASGILVPTGDDKAFDHKRCAPTQVVDESGHCRVEGISATGAKKQNGEGETASPFEPVANNAGHGNCADEAESGAGQDAKTQIEMPGLSA